jgi:hypothetical protein
MHSYARFELPGRVQSVADGVCSGVVPGVVAVTASSRSAAANPFSPSPSTPSTTPAGSSSGSSSSPASNTPASTTAFTASASTAPVAADAPTLSLQSSAAFNASVRLPRGRAYRLCAASGAVPSAEAPCEPGVFATDRFGNNITEQVRTPHSRRHCLRALPRASQQRGVAEAAAREAVSP